MSLREWIQAETDQTDTSTELSPAFIDEIIEANRVLERSSVEAMLASEQRAAVMRNWDPISRRVVIPLTDLTGDRVTYGGDFIYYFLPSTLQVLVDGSAIDVSWYSFAPRYMQVTFDPALMMAATVELRGHLVNMRYGGAMFQAFKSLAGRLSTLASVRGAEFEALAARIRGTAHRDWGPRSARRL